MSGNSKTGQSILATVLEQTAVWAYQRLHKVTYKPSEEPDDLEPADNDFSFKQLRDGSTSIYLIIPPDYLTEYRAVLRVMIGFAMRELRESFVEYKKSDIYKDKPHVLFILDEFPQLAYMRPIEEALLYLAGYDVRFWFFVQDLSQLQLHYPNSWQTFFANTGTQCFFGVSDIATANLVSEMAGMTTVQHTSTTFQNDQIQGKDKLDSIFYPESVQLTIDDDRTKLSDLSKKGELYFRAKTYHQQNHQVPKAHSSSTISNTSRPLITPDEVMRLPEDDQIIFMKGLKPIHCFRPHYYQFDNLNQFSQIKPPHDIDFF
jgi:type IV secretory pathway TraG/TraD family ATPase VirD4